MIGAGITSGAAEEEAGGAIAKIRKPRAGSDVVCAIVSYGSQ